MTPYDTFQPPREVDGRWAEYKSSQPEQRLDSSAQDARDVSRLVHSSIAKRAGRYRLGPEDVEDTRQEVMIGILAAQKRRGGRPRTVDEDAALIKHITRTVMSKGSDPTVNYRDQKALGVFREEIAQLELVGVTIDKGVRDQLAADIRQRAKPGGRPKEGFQELTKVHSLEVPIDEDGHTLADMIVAPESTDAGHASDMSPAASLLAARLNQEASQTDARREVWDAIAQTRDAALTVPSSILPGAATKVRKAVAEAGGVLAAARAWRPASSTTRGSGPCSPRSARTPRTATSPASPPCSPATPSTPTTSGRAP